MRKELVQFNCRARELKARDFIHLSGVTGDLLKVIGKPRVEGGHVTASVRHTHMLHRSDVGDKVTQQYPADTWLTVSRYILAKCVACAEEFPNLGRLRRHQIENGHWSVDYPDEPRDTD